MQTPDASSQDQVGNYYDSLDYFYRTAWGKRLHHGAWRDRDESIEVALDRMEALITAAVAPKSGEQILDIGCGYGALASWFSRTTGAKVDGITNSLVQFQVATDSHTSNLNRFRHARWPDGSYPPDRYDAVVSVECLSHAEDAEAFISETARVLRPGGRLVIADWIRGPQTPPATARQWILDPICKTGHLGRFRSPAEVQRFLTKAGFQAYEMRDLTPFAEPTWTRMAARLVRVALTNRRFALRCFTNPAQTVTMACTVIRLILAYRLGWIGYGLIVAVILK